MVSELGIVASDVPEVIGTALALKLIFGLPTGWRVLTSLRPSCFVLQHFGVKVETFIASLVAIMSLCYLGELFYCDNVDVGKVIMVATIPKIQNRQRCLSRCLCLMAVVCHTIIFTLGVGVDESAVEREDFEKAYKYNVIESGMALSVTLCINFLMVIVASNGNTENYRQWNAEMIDKPLQNAPKMLNKLLALQQKVCLPLPYWLPVSKHNNWNFAGQYVMDGFLKLRIHGFESLSTLRHHPVLNRRPYRRRRRCGNLNRHPSTILSIQLLALIPLMKFCSSPLIVRSLPRKPALRKTTFSGVSSAERRLLLKRCSLRDTSTFLWWHHLGMFAVLFISCYCSIYWLVNQSVIKT